MMPDVDVKLDANDFIWDILVALNEKHDELEKLSESPEANDALVFDIQEFLEGIAVLIKEQQKDAFFNKDKEGLKKQEQETIAIFLLSLYCFGPDNKKCFSTDEITTMLEKHKDVVCTILKKPSYPALMGYSIFSQSEAELMDGSGNKIQSGAVATFSNELDDSAHSNTAK